MKPDCSRPGIHAFRLSEVRDDVAVIHTNECSVCSGRGSATYSRSINSPFAGDLYSDDCWQCRGQGSVENETCGCDGCKSAFAGLAAEGRAA